MVRLNLIWSLFFSCSFLPLVNARWLTFSSTYAFLNLITRWEKLPGKGKIFLDSKINILEEWKIRNRDCTVKKKSDKLTRIITWCLTFCDSGIDERIIFDYIFGDMMSVSDTQYLKWSCTVWEYNTSKIRFKQSHHYLPCRSESTKMLVTIESNWWQIPLFRDDFESLGDLGKETTLDHWSETRWIQLFYYSFSKTKTKSHVGVSHLSSFMTHNLVINYETWALSHRIWWKF